MAHAEIDHILINRRWCLLDTSVIPSFCTGCDHRLLRAMIRFSNKREKNSLRRPRGKSPPKHDEQTLKEVLFKCAWQCKKDPTEDYELFVEGLKSCAKSASVAQARRSGRISITTKELLENRRKLKLDLTATPLTWLVIIAGCKRALQDGLQWYK
uniref:Zf-Tim10_DDP domain-containing protein n=1 Tax=Angiostrongylus cantonensis TaxID=6313 RepID=A0A0K0D548_ANGCA